MTAVVWHWDPATCKAFPRWKKPAQHWSLLCTGAAEFVTPTLGWRPFPGRVFALLGVIPAGFISAVMSGKIKFLKPLKFHLKNPRFRQELIP